jgi:hypothetical protein
MISEVELKAGSTPSASGLKIQTTPITVFVGPNNSGKSRVLREIERYCSTGSITQSDLVLTGIKFSPVPADKIEEMIAGITLEPRQDQSIPMGHVFVGSGRGSSNVPRANLSAWMASPEQSKPSFCQSFLQYRLLKLDGPSRINLVSEQAAGDLQGK